jgi:hypothetical protein
MGTEIAKLDLPAPTPQIAKSLSPQERTDHRQKIASEVKVVLSAYFQPHEDERIKAAQLAWWCDELEDWTQEQVVWALRKWNRGQPAHTAHTGRRGSHLQGREGQEDGKPSQACRRRPRAPAGR